MSYYLGVDLGTTYTAAALARDGRAEPATLGTRSVAIPSVVYFDGDELVVGQPAVRRAITEPARVASEFKRRLGDPVPILMGGDPVTADHLMARLLGWVVTQVSTTEGQQPAGLAVTHPANWGDYKIGLFREAIRAVGLEVHHFVPEPVAAANFYAANRHLSPGTVVAVYDLGGGTFDAAVVRSDPAGFHVVGRPDGIERLGGVDFDQAVFRHVVEVAGVDLDSVDTADEALMAGLAQLRLNCIEAKESLSAETNVSIPVMLPDLHTNVRLTRSELEAMIEPALRETLVALRRAIASADLAVNDVSAVLLVGGSSRIPLVAQFVTSELGRPIAVDARPKDAIPLGAAITAWRAATTPPPLPAGPAGPGAVPPPPPQIAVPHDLSQAPLPQPVALPPMPGADPPPAGQPGPGGPPAPPAPDPTTPTQTPPTTPNPPAPPAREPAASAQTHPHPAGSPVPPTPAPVLPEQHPMAPGAPPGSPVRRPRRLKKVAAAAAGLAALVVAGVAVWVVVPSGGGDDEIPPEAISRFNAACRQDFEVDGETLTVSDELCSCTLETARAELTTEQFMANDRLLQDTGDQLTQNFLDIMGDCNRRR